MTASAQWLGSDQPCTASTPCAQICGDHLCAPGETPNESPQTNQTVTQNVAPPSMPTPVLKLSTKGQISNSSGIAPGTVVWTALSGNNATFIFHGVNGLEVARLLATPNPLCNGAQHQVCFDGTVTQIKDPDKVLEVGAKAKISIDPIENLETVAFLSGAFQNIIIQIDLTHIWTYSTSALNPTLANPASVYCINNGGKIQMETNPSGQYGMCIFPNGSQCDEWQYYRGQCSPSSLPNTITASPVVHTNSTAYSTTNSTSTNSTSIHGTSINPNSTNGTITVTNSTYK